MSRSQLRTLLGLEFFTGAAAVVGGVLLVIDPDGSLLQADRSSLQDSPFADWRLPGVLLATLVGGGLLVTGVCHLLEWHLAGHLSVLAGAGLVAFELTELVWLGFQPLEAVFATVGTIVALLGWRVSRAPRGTDHGDH